MHPNTLSIDLPKIICLMGPTASGKTQLAKLLYRHLPCELMSVDSALIYRGMDIGTAKPTPEELQEYPHHLINIRDPSEIYSVADFRRDAVRLINQILSKRKIPLLVGGTLLYFKALQQGLSPLPARNDKIRERIQREAQIHGWPALHQRLVQIDSTIAHKIQPQDAQRIQRALEVFELTGQPMSRLQRIHPPQTLPYHFINIALIPQNRQNLYAQIEKRFDAMLHQGFIEEVKRLFQRTDLNRHLPAIRSVGYRQIWDYLDQQITWDNMRQTAITATRHLAKRQLTGLRNWENLYRLDPFDPHVLQKSLSHFYSQ